MSAEELAERACTIEIDRCRQADRQAGPVRRGVRRDLRHPLRPGRPRHRRPDPTAVADAPAAAAGRAAALLHRDHPQRRHDPEGADRRTSPSGSRSCTSSCGTSRARRPKGCASATPAAWEPPWARAGRRSGRSPPACRAQPLDEAICRRSEGGRDGRQGRRRRRRRLRAGVLPDGAPGRSARRDGGDEGAADQDRPLRLTGDLQRPPGHLGLTRGADDRRALHPDERTAPRLLGSGRHSDERARRGPGPARPRA